jgi:hypothetical protein
VTQLVQLGGIPSSAEITSCVKICGNSEVIIYREGINCGGTRYMEDYSEGSESRDIGEAAQPRL